MLTPKDAYEKLLSPTGSGWMTLPSPPEAEGVKVYRTVTYGREP